MRARVRWCECVSLHICVCFCKAGGINGLWDLWMFRWGGGLTDRTPCHCSAPVTEFAPKRTDTLPLTPSERLLPWPQDALNELMNHSGTPQLRHISVLLEGRVGGVDTMEGFWLKHSEGPRWPIAPKCSESKFCQGSS